MAMNWPLRTSQKQKTVQRKSLDRLKTKGTRLLILTTTKRLIPMISTAKNVPTDTKEKHADARELFQSLDQIHVCAIHPDRGDIFGDNFDTDIEAAIKFCADYNKLGFNAYWTVNRIKDGFSGTKPDKEHIVAGRFIHVDIDPPQNSSDFDVDKVANYLADMNLPPSFIIFSGNGVQAFFRLDGDHHNLNSIEYVNRQVEQFCNADHCHNCDRLMRIPSFMNYPNKKKREAGRVDSMARIMVKDTGQVFEAGEISLAFPEAVDLEKSDSLRTETTLAEFGGDLETPYSLGINVGTQVYDAVMNPAGQDRSRDGFRAGRLLAFDGHSDEEIAGVLLNPDLPIAAHFHDQKYPVRAVRRILEVVRVETPYIEPLQIDYAALTANNKSIGIA